MSFMQVFHRKRTPAEVLSTMKAAGPLGPLVWEKRELPSGGATTYAFETYGTPLYDFRLGNGAAVFQRPLRITSPAIWAKYTSPIIANPPQNIFQGQFVTQPLVDPNTAIALGFVAPNAIPPDAYNVIPPSAPTLAP